MRRLLATITLLGLMAGACGGEASPDEVLADLAEARNSGDVDAVMAFYADDAVVKDHVLDNDGVATGVDEIRALEEQIPAIQGSGDGVEYLDVVVSGDTVRFKSKFYYGADGTRSGGVAGCAGGVGHEATVENGKFTFFDWGQGSDSECLK